MKTNYCTHAMSDLSRLVHELHTNNRNREAKDLSVLLTVLDRADKFRLPDNGAIFDFPFWRDEFKEQVKMPFSHMAIEWPCAEGWKIDPTQVTSTKRITLAYKLEETFPPETWSYEGFKEKIKNASITGLKDEMPRHKMEEFIEDMDSKPIIGLFSIFYVDAVDAWSLSPFGIFFTEQPVFVRSSDVEPEKPTSTNKTANQAIVCQPMQVFDLLPGGPPPAFNRIMHENLTDIWNLIDLCIALNCDNVETEIEEAPIKLNRKRAKRKALPFYSYHVLKFKGHRHGRREGQGGTHASPRFHKRRGHFRHYRSGKVTWIHEMLVGDPLKGFVEKSYEVPSIDRADDPPDVRDQGRKPEGGRTPHG